MRTVFLISAIVLHLFFACSPISAASFDPTPVTISVDDPIWANYHLADPNAVGKDVEKIYKIKRVEIHLRSGDKEFGSFTFTPEDRKPQKISLLRGVSSTLMIRFKASSVENVIWVGSYPFKYVGDDVVIKSLPTAFTLGYPGI